ncbi:hypothetical protein EON67_04245 [archaeon]|nr:MAG: hypothetical protein EON67_04245 [archaeon]
MAALYSCHDYTLLCMLAALRYGRHPAECIDFAAFLLWRVWEEAEAAPASTRTAADRPRRTVSLHLCASPYPDARRGHPTYLRPHLVPIFEDVPVEALQHLADGWRADLVRAFPVLASNAWVQQPPGAAVAPTKRYGAC